MTTYDDAKLVVGLLQWGAQIKVNEAVSDLFSEDFDPEAASANDDSVRSVLSFGEILGTFVKRGVLDGEFAHDLFAIQLLWRKVGPAALKSRAAAGEPRLWENFEALQKTAPA